MNIDVNQLLPKQLQDFTTNSNGDHVDSKTAKVLFEHYRDRREKALRLLQMRFIDVLRGNKFVLR